MISRFSRLLIVLLVVASALYLVMLNRDTVTVHLSSSSVFSANLGIILIAAFSTGILVTAIVALFFGFKARLRESKLEQRDRARLKFLESLVEARGLQAIGDSARAKSVWEGLAKRDPTDVIARVEVARTMLSDENGAEALRLIDEARAKHSTNAEVLALAAEINLSLNNRTAALDNLALLIAQRPTRKMAVLARGLARDLGRLEDARKYHRLCQELGEREEENAAAGAELRLLQIRHEFGARAEDYRTELLALTKHYPLFAPALLELSAIEEERGNVSEAAQYRVRAAKQMNDQRPWNDAVRLWLRDERPDRAIAAAKAAIHGSQGSCRIRAELFLIRLLLSLHHQEEAERLLKGVPALAVKEQTELSGDALKDYLALQALCLFRMGKQAELQQTLQRLCDAAAPVPEAGSAPRHYLNGTEAPSPSLSTP